MTSKFSEMVKLARDDQLLVALRVTEKTKVLALRMALTEMRLAAWLEFCRAENRTAVIRREIQMRVST